MRNDFTAGRLARMRIGYTEFYSGIPSGATLALTVGGGIAASRPQEGTTSPEMAPNAISRILPLTGQQPPPSSVSPSWHLLVASPLTLQASWMPANSVAVRRFYMLTFSALWFWVRAVTRLNMTANLLSPRWTESILVAYQDHYDQHLSSTPRSYEVNRDTILTRFEQPGRIQRIDVASSWDALYAMNKAVGANQLTPGALAAIMYSFPIQTVIRDPLFVPNPNGFFDYEVPDQQELILPALGETISAPRDNAGPSFEFEGARTKLGPGSPAVTIRTGSLE